MTIILNEQEVLDAFHEYLKNSGHIKETDEIFYMRLKRKSKKNEELGKVSIEIVGK